MRILSHCIDTVVIKQVKKEKADAWRVELPGELNHTNLTITKQDVFLRIFTLCSLKNNKNIMTCKLIAPQFFVVFHTR